MNTIGKVYRNLGLYDEASPMLETALELRRQVTAVEDVASAELLADLANLYIDQGRYPEAEVMLTQAVDVMNRHGGEVDRLELAESINKLASVYRRQGKYDLAEPLYYQAKDIRVAVLGPDDPEVARSYNSLGILNWTRGNYDEAETLYRQALDLWEKAYGNDHSDVAKALQQPGPAADPGQPQRRSRSPVRKSGRHLREGAGPGPSPSGPGLEQPGPGAPGNGGATTKPIPCTGGPWTFANGRSDRTIRTWPRP